MKIAFVAQTTEMEMDIVKAAAQSGDEVRVYSVSDAQGGHGRFTPHDKTNMPEFVPWAILDLLERVRSWQADLVVLRYPFWLGQTGLLDEAREVLRGQPVLVYQTEQGPTREWGIMYSCGWKHVAVNCRADEVVYRLRLPGQHIHYLPFGTRSVGADELAFTPRYSSEIVSDGWAHHACKCYGGWKGRSVNIMIRPLLDLDIALYGRVDAEGYKHSWVAVPGMAARFRGEYPQEDYTRVYASAKVYVGASWNWAHGGYGIRFPKILACGIPLVWHKTVWNEREGLFDGEQALFPSSSAETRQKVLHLLEHPDEAAALGKRGQAWVREHWDWMTNLRRVAEEVA